jgi:hypothetical protein
LIGEDKANVIGAAPMEIVIGPVTVAVGLLESVPSTVRLVVPAMVGVPVIAHPVALRPAGRVPLRIEHA